MYYLYRSDSFSLTATRKKKTFIANIAFLLNLQVTPMGIRCCLLKNQHEMIEVVLYSCLLYTNKEILLVKAKILKKYSICSTYKRKTDKTQVEFF